MFCLDYNFCLERTRPPRGDGSADSSRLLPAIVLNDGRSSGRRQSFAGAGRPGVNLVKN